MEDEDFLDDLNQQDDVAEALPTPEKVAEEPAIKEPSPAPVEPAPVKDEAKPEPGFVPIGAVLDERDRRKKLEAEVETLRRQHQAPAEPFKLPDMFEDPDGYTAALGQQFEQRLYQTQLQMSQRFAVQAYGEETTQAAVQWAASKCDADPYFNEQVKASGDPVGFAVQQYKRDQIVSTVTPDDFEQFKAWKLAQQGLSAPQAATPAPTPAAPPKSLATAPSAGNIMTDVVQTDEEIFAEIFPRK